MPLYMTARKPWQRYLFAILAFSAAAVVRAEFLGILGPRAPYLTFYPAVVVAAIYAGVTAGLLVTIISAVYITFWMSPIGQIFAVQDAADRVGVAIFIMSCTIVCFITKGLHNAQLRIAEAESQVELAELRRLHEMKLRESEERYRALFENSMDGVFLTAWDGEIIAANRAACEIFGMTEDEFRRAGRAGVLDFTDPRVPGTRQS